MKMRESVGGGGARFTDSPVNASSKKRSRTIYTPYQTQKLEEMFQKNNFPARDVIDGLRQSLDISDSRLMNWFKNRRARSRREPKEGSPVAELEGGPEGEGPVEDVSPPTSPQYKPHLLTNHKPASQHTGNYSISRLIEKDPAPVPDIPEPPPRHLPPHPGSMPIKHPNPTPHQPSGFINHPNLTNQMFNHSPQPIRHLHHMTSFLAHTSDRSLTSSLSQVLISQIDHHVTPEMNFRSLRHLESLQSRPVENGFHQNVENRARGAGCSDGESPMWDLYFSYREETVAIREYFDAIPGVSRNVVQGENGQVLLVL